MVNAPTCYFDQTYFNPTYFSVCVPGNVEQAAITDRASKTPSKILHDILRVSDYISKRALSKRLTDAVHVMDVLSSSFLRSIFKSIGDYLEKQLHPSEVEKDSASQ